MTSIRGALVVLSALVVAVACAPLLSDSDVEAWNGGIPTVLTGALSYREPVVLPAGSIAVVSLTDDSRDIVATTTVDLGGRQVPVHFSLTVPGGALEHGARYALRGTIAGPDGRLLWTADTAVPVQPGKAALDLGTLLLVRAPENAIPLDSER
jgi:putative lipoprotein